ncbi:hypothetical protein AB0P02_01045 [Streptomyces griseoluteus]|uniref:hypothetical protein n=1 Tax=Streptomyces griseoluteus TaxID=29306 RepID=UPI00344AABE5
MPIYDGHHTAPRNLGRASAALEAAKRLAALVHHVHLVSSNESRCISHHCKEN